MPRPYIITALDIGSGFIKILSVSKKPGEPDFEVSGLAQEHSSGIRKGVVIDIPKVVGITSFLTKKIEQESGKKTEGVYASFGGGHIFCTSSHGLVSVSRADQKISEEDIDRVIQAAKTFPLPSNKEIIEVFPKEFFVDGEGKIKEAVGMEGVRLEADILALCCFSPYLKNSSQAVLNSGLQVYDLTPAPLASAKAVLTPREKELGVCVLDIGSGTTGMAVFEEDVLLHTAIFPIGSGHITNDIAICLKTDIDTAERIKLEFGGCRKLSPKGKPGKNEKKIKIEGEESLVFSRKILADIIEARVSEIFTVVNKELKRISRQGLLPAGVVLTGGGAKLPGIKELAKKELKLPCRVGAPRGFASLPEDPALSTLCGLILGGIDLEEEGTSPGVGKGIREKIKKIFRIFIP
jgi:cell division protein FtsA